jgi:Holliday junction DNA helicase RuvB
MPRERIVQTESEGEEENRANYALRPTSFDQYIGQEQLILKLRIAVQAAKSRGEPVDPSRSAGAWQDDVGACHRQ